MLDMAPAELSSYENDHAEPYAYALDAIAGFLDMTVEAVRKVIEETKDIVKQRRHEFKASMMHMQVAHARIDEAVKKGNMRGFVECPRCGGDKLYYQKSGYNGHIMGKCETEHCMSWMQ
jgi:hypothetical protein